MKIIESITIRYFRSVYTITLSECKDMTVITGKNDVGKSNILKALNLFFCQQSDYLNNFKFSDDYSIIRKKEVTQDTIRGQQFISITVAFLRGERMINSLPPKFSVTKRWDMHSQECKVTTDVLTRMQQYAKKQGIKYSEKTTSTSLSTFLNKIKYIYIPAIKDERVFQETLNLLQQSLFDSKNKKVLDAPINQANKAVQEIISGLQSDFESSTGIANFVELPNTLNYTKGLLQINTSMGDGTVTIDKRGDGIRTHYIPKILNYVAENSRNIYIWGFEEPENSYEYGRCMQVAEEFESQYSVHSQIFITSHSPAFFGERDNKTIVRIGNKQGKTVVMKSDIMLEEELGYIEIYKDYIEKVKKLQELDEERVQRIDNLKSVIEDMKAPILLTEGKTDASLLKIAIERLNLQEFGNWLIQPIVSKGTSNNDVLLRYLLDLKDNMTPAGPVIGMFDRDTPLEIVIDGKKVDIRAEKFVKIKENIYAFAIPVPHNRKEENDISIEHFFTDQEIRTEKDGKRLFLGNEFYETGVYKGDEEFFYKGARNCHDTIKIIEHESKLYVTKEDGTGDYSLSKARFVECIEQCEKEFADFSFQEFHKIFQILKEICEC